MPRKRTGTLPESLIMSKLNPPELDTRLVWRTTLIERLIGGTGRTKVISIVAAAGSGKSTLMAQLRSALHNSGCSTCWVSLDTDDDNPAAFATYFMAGLSALELPAAHRELALTGANPVRDFEALFDSLVAQLSTLRGESAIFLDDFHEIQDQRILRFINKLITHAPSSVRMIIASRSRLPLDLARHRVSGQLQVVEQEDLNFDSAQAADFLVHSHDLRLNPDDLTSLLATTEGWPAGLQLAALALRRHHGTTSELIRTFSGRDQDLVSYLAEAVLRSQPDAVRKFLLLTAPLRRMSAELCHAVSSHPNSAEMLGHLARSHLFVIALDREGQWYRYHHLFAEFLHNELMRSDPASIPQICDRAAQWCEEHGHTTEAIQYALDGGLYEKATDLIAKHAPTVSQVHGDHYTVLDWMRRLPEVYHNQRPEILLSDAWSRAFARDTGRAILLADSVVQKLRDGGHGWQLSDAERQYLQLLARVIRAIAKACADEIDECMALANELRRQIPGTAPFLIGSICNCISYCHFARREYEDSTRAAADAYLSAQRATSAYPAVWADFLQGLANVEMGRLRLAQEHGLRAEAAAKTVEGTAKNYTSALAALLNAQIATQRCEFDMADVEMETGRTFSALFGPLEPLLVAIRTHARIHAWRGDLDAARLVLMNGQDMALSTDQPRLFMSLAIEEASLQLRVGDVDAAQETIKRARLRDAPQLKSGAGGALQLLDVRLQLIERQSAAALRALGPLQHSHGEEASGNVALALRTLKAIALWQCDRSTEAVRELDRVLSAAAPEFHAYPIASCGAALLPVLRAIGERRAEVGTAADLLAKRRLERVLMALLSGEKPSRSAPHPEAVDFTAPLEALTSREVELLRLVDAGLANRQLANALLISEATVKWHLHNIYLKMGVRNRSAAAARARDLMLL